MTYNISKIYLSCINRSVKFAASVFVETCMTAEGWVVMCTKIKR